MKERSAIIARLDQYRERIESAVLARLPAAQTYPARLHEALRYAAEGGKRVRALLIYAAGEVLEVAPEQLDAAACAIEFIHAYSLVHDDLPAMDDDALRRGRPTVHVAYDEATAILVGDALQSLAFSVLARPVAGLKAQQQLSIVGVLADAAGSQGMVGGQAVDLASEGQRLSLPELERLHFCKTGALILACLQIAVCAAPKADSAARDALDRYGRDLGLAYQIQDDVLDVEGSSEVLGKTQGKDQAQEKSTYVALMGLEAARERASALFNSACDALNVFGERRMSLELLARHIQGRDH
jgi:geranylgeranyl pyrophosphate synthase